MQVHKVLETGTMLTIRAWRHIIAPTYYRGFHVAFSIRKSLGEKKKKNDALDPIELALMRALRLLYNKSCLIALISRQQTKL